MRTKILFSIALIVGILALVLMFIGSVDQSIVTALLVIGLVCISIEFIMGKKNNHEEE